MHKIICTIGHETYTMQCDNLANVHNITVTSLHSPYAEHTTFDNLGGFVRARCEQRILHYFRELRNLRNTTL